MNSSRYLVLPIACALVSGCATIPMSVKTFASELPARADGQYAPLDDTVKKQLVMKDALLQCKIDADEGKPEPESAACKCATSANEDWIGDCRGWLGDHAPTSAPPPSPIAANEPTPASPGEE